MASDEDYMNFLDKANQDPSAGSGVRAKGAKAELKATDKNVEVPEPLLAATKDAFYVSDADEPFVPVALEWDEAGKGLPDEGTLCYFLYYPKKRRGEGGRERDRDQKLTECYQNFTEEFATLIHHWDPKNAEIEILDPVDWDSQGQYSDIIDAARKAGEGNDVRVYKVVKDSTRVEYWVVTTQGRGKGARLVGAKALAVES